MGVPFPALQSKRDEACRFVEELVEFCLTGRHPELGLPQDENRLVQRFTWYLLCVPDAPITGFSDNPGLDLETSALMRADGTLTDIGEALIRTVDRLVSNQPFRSKFSQCDFGLPDWATMRFVMPILYVNALLFFVVALGACTHSADLILGLA